MFVRVKKSGSYQYLQLVENRKDAGKVRQRVIATLGRLDRLQAKGQIDGLVRSLSRFSKTTLVILSGKGDVEAEAVKIGPVIIFQRLWSELGIGKVIGKLVAKRRFGFDVERAIFQTVLHRLLVSGSDRFCDQWRQDYWIPGTEDLQLHHLYRAMAFLGEPIRDQEHATPFAPRCTKDIVEEELFHRSRDLFSQLDLVFFDTTSIYFEGGGGQSIGRRGFSKDHRPDLNQMVVGAVIDEQGRPICCEMWPGNTTDVKSLIPVADRIRKRFGVNRFCIVADRGMISADTMEALEDEQRRLSYILGCRMKRVKKIREQVLSTGGRYSEVRPEGLNPKAPAPLKVKEVCHDDKRYIICLNPQQARKDAADRQAILASLEEQLKKGAKRLVGNKGYRRYVKVAKGSMRFDTAKVRQEARYDGKWVLTTNTDLPAATVALKYKELWQVEKVFRDVKSVLDTRPIFHQRDDTIRGHVFCSFLALVLRKELERRLNHAGQDFEWNQIKQDLKALQEVTVKEQGMKLAIRT